MPRKLRQPGAVPERLQKDGEPRCQAILPTVNSGGYVTQTLQCAYHVGYPGLHYSRGECW